ncbi:MAG: DNA mismatch repair protein MutS [Myxococcota bacterium]
MRRRTQALARADRQGAMLAHLRTVAFLGFAGLVLAVIFEKVPRLGLLGALAFLALYVGLAIVHARVLRSEAMAKVLLSLNQRGLARLDGKWHDFPERGSELLPDGHLYGADLDVVGQGSLFQRLDDTGTKAGERQLAQWLLTAAPDAATVRARQDALKELAPQLDFRQALITEARLAGKDKADPARFIAWAEGPSSLDAIRWAFPIAHVLPIFTISAGLLAANDLISPLPFWGGLAIQVGIVFATRIPLGKMWEALMLGERGFIRFEETFRAIDAQQFRAPLLQSLKAGLSDGPPVSTRLAAFARLMGFAELRSSGQLHPIINALTLWDVLFLFRLDAWRAEHGKGVRGWFDALSQLEALASFASWPFERPQDCWPEVDDGPVHLEAKELGHPLLERPVTNDVVLAGPGHGWVITGSNMSGKTTLMRTVGLNTVMALAGLPVRAAAFKVSRVQVMTSMRVKDSLERGVSYFYAEVQRIKTLLDTAKANRDRCLFLLDELFMGTNTKERQVASKQLLLLLLDQGAAGAVTTHDLSLCELAGERPERVKNVHFRDQITDGEMTFDYRLRDGVVQTTNALEVLRRAGIPVG